MLRIGGILVTATVGLLLAVGCAGSGSVASYDTEENQTRFDTGTMTVGQVSSGGGFASQTDIVMRATAKCTGRDCTPERASLIFSVQSTSEFALPSRSLTITADGREFSGGRASDWSRQRDIDRVEGRLAKVTLPLSDLAAIANANEVDGSLGNLSLDLQGVQGRLQSFVKAAQNPEAERSVATE